MEVPVPYVKANQIGIVLFVIMALWLQQPLILAVLLLIQIIGLLSSGRYNLFIRIVKPFIHTQRSEMQALELTRFNNTLAVLFLTLSLASFALDWSISSTIFALMLLIAAGAAILGYCIGCTIYYQYKHFIALRKARSSK